MEKNNFNKAYMYIVGIFAIGIAISNIISFFSGVGFALIGSSLLLFLAISNILKSEHKKRFGDIAVLLVLEFMMFIVLFFAYDFNLNGLTNKFPLVMRNICAIYSIFALAYVLFRYISEIKGVKYNFVEYMLGNYIPEPKEKKIKPSKDEIRRNKELENGTLAPKPSSMENNTNIASEQTTIENSPVQEEATESASNDNIIIEESDEVENSVESNSQSTTEAEPTHTTNDTNRTGFWN